MAGIDTAMALDSQSPIQVCLTGEFRGCRRSDPKAPAFPAGVPGCAFGAVGREPQDPPTSRQLAAISLSGHIPALQLAQDRNLSVHMYRKEIGEQIGGRLAAHAVLLRRWLEAMQARGAAS